MNTCAVCKNKNTVIFAKTKNRSLIFCKKCKIIYVSDEKKKRLIPESKFFKEYLNLEKNFRECFKRYLIKIYKYKVKGKLLDIGSGAGFFLSEAKMSGWEVSGIEASKSSAKFASKKGFKIYNSTIEKAKVKTNSYDAVTMFQLIEHLEDPVKVLKKANTLLKKNGIIVISTPNRESLLGKLMNKKWFGYYNDEHLFVFDKESLRNILEETGFKVLSIEEDNGKILTPAWVLIRLSDYYYNHKNNLKKYLDITRPLWRYLDWIKFYEPQVDLVVIAKK